MADDVPVHAEWLAQIEESLSGLRFGVVQIVIHNGQLVQIERTERLRFDGPREAAAESASKPRRKQ